MLKILRNDFEGCYAAPKEHPITCLNPAPWKIIEMKIEKNWEMGVKVFIRGEESMWFRADQCFIDKDIEEVKMYMEMHNIK